VRLTLRPCGHSPCKSPARIGRYADTSIDGVQPGETRCVTSCPFCGNAARTKEHVWPRWLRKYGAYQVMSEDDQDNVSSEASMCFNATVRTEFGKSSPTSGTSRSSCRRLIDVCSDCNNGWMAAMEIAVRDLLDPVMRSHGTDVTARLEPEDQVLLATWMSKCVYAYSADLTPQNRPWSENE
jgi:hypothetical protein